MRKEFFDLFDFEKGYTANGVPVYTKNLPWISGWVQLRILIHTGAEDDPIGKEGLAHFFEHMPFEGSLAHSREKIKTIKEKIFHGTFNATTYFNGIKIHGKLLKKDISKAAAFLNDFILKPLLKEASIEKERKAIIREIWEKLLNQKKATLYKKLCMNVYRNKNHYCVRMEKTFGYEESVSNISRSDLLEFHEKNIHLSNISIALAGDITLPEALASAEKFCKNFPLGRPRQKKHSYSSWPKPIQNIISLSLPDIWLTESVSGSASVVRLLPRSIDRELIDVLGEIVRDELFHELREKLGKTYGPQVTSAIYSDHYYWNVSVNTAPSDVETVSSIILSIYKKILSDPKMEKIFNQKKILLKNREFLLDYDVESLIDYVSRSILDGKIVTVKETIESIEILRFENLKKLIRNEFRPELLCLTKFKP